MSPPVPFAPRSGDFGGSNRGASWDRFRSGLDLTVTFSVGFSVALTATPDLLDPAVGAGEIVERAPRHQHLRTPTLRGQTAHIHRNLAASALNRPLVAERQHLVR